MLQTLAATDPLRAAVLRDHAVNEWRALREEYMRHLLMKSVMPVHLAARMGEIEDELWP